MKLWHFWKPGNGMQVWLKCMSIWQGSDLEWFQCKDEKAKTEIEENEGGIGEWTTRALWGVLVFTTPPVFHQITLQQCVTMCNFHNYMRSKDGQYHVLSANVANCWDMRYITTLSCFQTMAWPVPLWPLSLLTCASTVAQVLHVSCSSN